MSLGQDPRLIVAHWADEATRAAADTEASQARENGDQDRLAAVARAEAAATPRRSTMRRVFSRMRHPAR
jgi:hypothetical protein